MSSRIEVPPESELLKLPGLDTALMAPHDRNHYERYRSALISFVKGSTLSRAAKGHAVRRSTLANVVEEAFQLHPDGRLVGFRACICHRRRVTTSTRTATSLKDDAAPPASLEAALCRVPAAAQLVATYKGRLPERNRTCRTFDRLLCEFKKLLTTAGLGQAYPLNTIDQGRRALVRRIRKARAHVPTSDFDTDSTEMRRATRLEDVFALQPMDRIEGDGHRTDVHWHAQIPTPDGGWTTRLISSLWLIVFVDVVSHTILAWNVIVGRSYNRFDVLRTVARSLTPWRPRALIIPNASYHPEAWMPSAVESEIELIRPCSAALDNAMAHLSKATTDNLGEHQLGVINLGYPGVPEGRPNVEALFKLLEEQVFRRLAGGFRPESANGDPAHATTNLRPEDYPVQLQALDDLLDIAITTYNATPQDSLQQRSPRQVFEQYFDAGAAGVRSSLTSEDADAMTLIRFKVTIRGARGRHKRQPFIRYMDARYRSDSLRDRFDLIGQTFDASVPAKDLRRIALWKDGQLYAVLHALTPWARSVCDFETRQRAMACRARGLVDWVGKDDAVAEYMGCVRDLASKRQWATDEFLRLGLADIQALPRSANKPPTAGASPLFDLSPRRRPR